MLTADGLLLVVMLGACALVVLGTLELVWPTRPRHPVRRRVRAADVRRRRRPRIAPVLVPPATVPAPVVTAPEAPASTDAAPAFADAAPASTDAAPPSTDAEPAPAAVAPASTDASPVEVPSPAEPVVDRGFALVKAGRFSEAAALGREALEAMKAGRGLTPTTGAAQETARLWGLVGLARQGLDEVDDARFAFEEAIAHAAGSERPAWERHLAALALTVGRRALAGTDTAPAQRIATLETAIEWLDRGLAVCPDDGELGRALAAAHESLWGARESAAADHLQRKEYVAAQRLLDEAMADPECPEARNAILASLLARALTGQAREAMSEALRHRLAGRAAEATAALGRAEGLLTPLSRAWSLARADAERERAVRTSLVGALDEIVDAQADEVDALIDAGDLGTAQIHAEKLETLLRGAAEQGLSPDDLAYASGRVTALFARMHSAT